MNRYYFMVLMSYFATTKSMDLDPQPEAQAEQEISRIEAFMTSDFQIDADGIVTYDHFVTRANKATYSKLKLTRRNHPLPSFSEPLSTMHNYLVTLSHVMNRCMTPKKYLEDPIEKNTSFEQKDVNFINNLPYEEDVHKALIKFYKKITAQDLAQLTAVKYYAFLKYLDLQELATDYEAKRRLAQHRKEFIEAFDKKSIDAIREVLAKHDPLTDIYRHRSICMIVHDWIDSQERLLKRSEP